MSESLRSSVHFEPLKSKRWAISRPTPASALSTSARSVLETISKEGMENSGRQVMVGTQAYFSWNDDAELPNQRAGPHGIFGFPAWNRGAGTESSIVISGPAAARQSDQRSLS